MCLDVQLSQHAQKFVSHETEDLNPVFQLDMEYGERLGFGNWHSTFFHQDSYFIPNFRAARNIKRILVCMLDVIKQIMIIWRITLGSFYC